MADASNAFPQATGPAADDEKRNQINAINLLARARAHHAAALKSLEEARQHMSNMDDVFKNVGKPTESQSGVSPLGGQAK